MTPPSTGPLRGWWVAAVTGPVVWAVTGLFPVVWSVQQSLRDEDQGPPIALAVSVAVTIAIQAIALPTLAITASNPTSQVLRVLALTGHVALLLVTLLAWVVLAVDRFVVVMSLVALTTVSIASTVGWLGSSNTARRG